eukprot:gnl/MRDRNA2_/MRDRNA2_96222_c0_seq1.p1 gnl/MRDRNA2_/MRDRNA2_96222_c0~~gnl/MRDRNA2_/MRDRNA2_96222_c0_seq1.p1  ORF type:complete len:670 (-),score=173.86 gnl/MRDRNA2_/MRDRNA2_96222_c0_seq1:22-2031(-)
MSGYGYGDVKRRGRDRSRSGGRDERDGGKRKDKKYKDRGTIDLDGGRSEKGGKKDRYPSRDRRDRGGDRDRRREGRSRSRDRRDEDEDEGDAGSGGEADAPRKNWREEINEVKTKEKDDEPLPGDGGLIQEENEADVERVLEQSRKRREALIAKWVNRGEAPGAGELGITEAGDTPQADFQSESENSDAEDGGIVENDDDKLDENAKAKKKEEARKVNQFILATKKAELEGDMFDDDAENDVQLRKKGENQAQNIGLTGASADDWDDVEGYYKAKLGELIEDRYEVVEEQVGKGVFSHVLKAKDRKKNGLVAIKVMRANDMMKKAAEKEIQILQRVNRADKKNQKHVIQMMRYFEYRGHLCLVFECMWDNLRVALKKYTQNKGMSLQAVKAYTKQLLTGLKHIHKCGIMHCDIKPDNILISAGHNVVKICDLGSASDISEVEVTPYLVSRYYRAPEIILGQEYGPPADNFAMGAALYELFTGKILLPGRSNNDMLRWMMEVKGKFSNKMIKRGESSITKNHFNANMDFKFIDVDKGTRKKVVRVITDGFQSNRRTFDDMIMARVGPDKRKSQEPDDVLYCKKAKQFADILEKLTMLDPEKRMPADEGLSHVFVTEAGPGKSKSDDKGGPKKDEANKTKNTPSKPKENIKNPEKKEVQKTIPPTKMEKKA